MSIMLSLCLVISAVAFVGGSASALASSGEVISVRGRPLLHLKGASAGQQIGPGDEVDAGDVIRTDSQSTAKILLADDTVVDVHPASSVTIARVTNPTSPKRDVRLDVDRGKVRAQINQEVERAKGRFEIHTRAAYMGVEGTDFVVEAAPPSADGRVSTTISVIEGQVFVGSESPTNQGRKLVLTAGMRFTATARLVGNAIQQDPFRSEDIRRLERGALDELSRDARLSNDTFLQSIALSGASGRFGFSTLQGLNAQLKTDTPAASRSAANDVLFKRRFRDDELNGDAGIVPVSVEFPQ